MPELPKNFIPINTKVDVKALESFALVLFNPEKRKVKMHSYSYQQWSLSKRKGSIH